MCLKTSVIINIIFLKVMLVKFRNIMQLKKKPILFIKKYCIHLVNEEISYL